MSTFMTKFDLCFSANLYIMVVKRKGKVISLRSV